MTTPDAPASFDLDMTERGETQPVTGRNDDNDVPAKSESSHVAGSKLANDSDGSPKSSENLDPVRTLHGFKVCNPEKHSSRMTYN